MAYNNVFPMAYPQYYSQIPSPQPQQIQQIQNGGFISVRNEDEARNYPVAPGMSVTFIDENRKHVYSKTMGFSQLDRPMFDKYKLVKEDVLDNEKDHTTSDKYALKSDLDALKDQFEMLSLKIDEFEKKGMEET